MNELNSCKALEITANKNKEFFVKQLRYNVKKKLAENDNANILEYPDPNSGHPMQWKPQTYQQILMTCYF